MIVSIQLDWALLIAANAVSSLKANLSDSAHFKLCTLHSLCATLKIHTT